MTQCLKRSKKIDNTIIRLYMQCMNPNQKFDPEQNRNMLIAMFLAGLIMLGFEVFYNQPLRAQQATQRAEAAKIASESKQKTASEILQNVAKKKFESAPDKAATDIKAFLQERQTALATSQRVKINNGELHGSINLQGARLDDITLANYHLTIDKKSPEVVLASPSGSFHSNFIETGWLADDKAVAVPSSNTAWELVEGKELSQKTPVILQWNNGQGLTFRKKFSIDEKFMISVEDEVENSANLAANLTPFGLISKKRPQGIESEPLGISNHTGAITVSEDGLQEISYKDMTEKTAVTQDAATDWIGVADKYWLKAIVPNDKSFKATFRYSGTVTDKFQADYLGKEISVRSGEKITQKNMIYMGAKKLKTLEAYAKHYDIRLFDRAVNFGALYFIAQPLYHLLLIFYDLVGNFGVAIFMLTICVKLLLFPLSRKAYISMGKMKLLSPKIKDIQEKYKDDKMKLSQETMALYKREGVNPAAGCLPILLQIPFFISLYRLIFSAIEMRHAPFFGWIQDLSAADPTSIFNLFGALPYEVPAYLAFGVWPLVMCTTMYLQQMLNPAPADPIQAKVMRLLPLFFLFMFHSFPAGLMVYWSFSNSFTFLQQLYFTRNLAHKNK